MAQILDGKALAKKIKEQVAAEAAALPRRPGLAVLLVGENPADTIRALGGERLIALHMHDNNLHQDMHTILGAGKLDFVSISEALKEVNYQGDYALEVGLHYPKDLIPEALRHLATVCRYYADLASN